MAIIGAWLFAGGRYQDDLKAYLERFRQEIVGDVPHAALVNTVINNLILVLNGENLQLKENLRSSQKYFSTKLAEEFAVFVGDRSSVPWTYTGWRDAMTGDSLLTAAIVQVQPRKQRSTSHWARLRSAIDQFPRWNAYSEQLTNIVREALASGGLPRELNLLI